MDRKIKLTEYNTDKEIELKVDSIESLETMVENSKPAYTEIETSSGWKVKVKEFSNEVLKRMIEAHN